MELTIEQKLQRGVAAHKEGKLQEAERLYRAILQSQPLHSDANHNLGVLAVSVNKAVAALPLFKTALESNPKIEQFWFSYIDALISEKRFDNAKQVIQQGKKQGVDGERLSSLEAQLSPITQKANPISVSPPQQQLRSLLDHYQAERYEDAEKLALSLTQEFPTHVFGWKVLGVLFGHKGRQAEALNANQKTIKLSPQDAEAHNNLGITFKELGRLEEAEASYKQAIALKPDFAEAHNNLGITLKELSRSEEAEESYKQAIALKPDNAGAYSNLGITLRELGRLKEAEESFRQVIKLKPDNAEAYSHLGITLQKCGRLEEAKASYRQAIVLKPVYAEAHSNLGITLEELERLEESEESYRKAIGFKPDLAAAHSNLGGLLMRKGQHREGLNEIIIGDGIIYFDLKNGLSI